MKKAKKVAKLTVQEPLRKMAASMKKDEVYFTAMINCVLGKGLLLIFHGNTTCWHIYIVQRVLLITSIKTSREPAVQKHAELLLLSQCAERENPIQVARRIRNMSKTFCQQNAVHSFNCKLIFVKGRATLF